MSRKYCAIILCLALCALLIPAGTAAARTYGADDPNHPTTPVKVVFVHHSSGEHWLNDIPNGDGTAGGLGVALRDNNYFVSDTNYGWGPADADMGYETIGDHTNIGSWHNWFRGPHSAAYLSALYNESGQWCSYSRMGADPGGQNQIIMFKSCFPKGGLGGSSGDAPTPIGSDPLVGDPENTDPSVLTVGNAKGIYVDLLEYFRTRQDKLFVVICAPPLIDGTYAPNARTFNEWLVNNWLASYPYKNVFVWDYYNVLTSNGGGPGVNDLGAVGGNHHRWWNGGVQHQVASGGNTEAYPSADDHA